MKLISVKVNRPKKKKTARDNSLAEPVRRNVRLFFPTHNCNNNLNVLRREADRLQHHNETDSRGFQYHSSKFCPKMSLKSRLRIFTLKFTSGPCQTPRFRHWLQCSSYVVQGDRAFLSRHIPEKVGWVIENFSEIAAWRDTKWNIVQDLGKRHLPKQKKSVKMEERLFDYTKLTSPLLQSTSEDIDRISKQVISPDPLRASTDSSKTR